MDQGISDQNYAEASWPSSQASNLDYDIPTTSLNNLSISDAGRL